MDENKETEQTTTQESETKEEVSGASDEVKEENVKEEDTASKEEDETEGKETTEEDETVDEPKDDAEDNPKEETKDIDPNEAKEADIDKATDVLKDKGFDYAELSKEFNEKGEISKETREKLAKVGITGEIVDNYIEGQKARVEKELDDLSLCVGGREQMNEVIRWASQNISDEEKASINSITDANVMKIVLKDLKNRMEEKEGKVPEAQLNGEGGKPTVEIYESQAQMFEAIKDPRYKTDEAYRAKVMKKIQASREAGIDLGI